MILEAGRKALVVDDQPVGQKGLAMLLNGLGMKVVLAKDGKEAIEQFDSEVDLIFMDFYMPNVNGDEATKAIREKAAAFYNPKPKTNLPLLSFATGFLITGVKLPVKKALSSQSSSFLHRLASMGIYFFRRLTACARKSFG